MSDEERSGLIDLIQFLFVVAVSAFIVWALLNSQQHITCPAGYIVVADRYGREFCGLAGSH